jgi:hypothetical protein
MAEEAGLEVKTGEGGLTDSLDRPGDLVIKNWVPNQDLYVDVTVRHPLILSKERSGKKKEEDTVEWEDEKLQRYADLCSRERIKFLPFALNTFACFGKNAIRFLSHLGKLIASKNAGSSISEQVTFKAGVLSSLVMQQVARQLAMVHTTPSSILLPVPFPSKADMEPPNLCTESAGDRAPEESDDSDSSPGGLPIHAMMLN